MKALIVKTINRILRIGDLKITRRYVEDNIIDGDEDFMEIFKKCKDYTGTRKERMFALYESVKYVIKKDLKGDFVETGVWKGGSCMLIALTLQKLGVTGRKIWLYDTFEGMVEPTKEDNLIQTGENMIQKWESQKKKDHNDWTYSPLDEVKQNMNSTGYPEENLIYVEGKVQDTIPRKAPREIALLRLDTDWYESSKHELKYLYPLLRMRGVLILDDYGHFEGVKKAVDDYFKNKPVMMNRIDYCGRLILK